MLSPRLINFAAAILIASTVVRELLWKYFHNEISSPEKSFRTMNAKWICGFVRISSLPLLSCSVQHSMMTLLSGISTLLNIFYLVLRTISASRLTESSLQASSTPRSVLLNKGFISPFNTAASPFCFQSTIEAVSDVNITIFCKLGSLSLQNFLIPVASSIFQIFCKQIFRYRSKFYVCN
jgi:hypothetical protein